MILRMGGGSSVIYILNHRSAEHLVIWTIGEETKGDKRVSERE